MPLANGINQLHAFHYLTALALAHIMRYMYMYLYVTIYGDDIIHYIG